MIRRRAVLTLAAAVLASGGCSVSIGNDRRAPAFRRFQETQRVDLDLRTPLTRERAGIGPGTNSVIVERDRGGMLDADFQLPDAGRLRVPAIGVAISCSPKYGAVPPEVDPEQIVVNRIEDDLAAAGRALLADAALLGLDPARIQEFVASSTGTPDRTNVEFPPHDVGYLYTQVGVRNNVDRVQINYTFLWGEYGARVRAF